MEVLCLPVLKTIGDRNLPVPSVRMAQLFFEFLGRYNEWKIAQRQKTIESLILLYLGLCSLFLPWLLPGGTFIIMILMVVLFYFATRHYIDATERVSHLYVNVHILHHHLIGKLEVGFCDHSEPCQCVEHFRCYVLKEYGICLDNGPLR